MKIHRFIDNFDLSQKELEIKGEIAHQIIRVLKLKPKELIELGDGKNGIVLAKIVKIEKEKVITESQKILENKEKSKNRTVLFCSILKKENFELVVQKATECGISKIVPIISARTIKTGLNLERLRKIAKEASEQSLRSYIPEISEPLIFEKSLKLVSKNDLNILFDSSGEKYSCIINNNSPITNVWIGPEGGWTEKEVIEVKNKNFKINSLGNLILRAETAAIVATYLVSNF